MTKNNLILQARHEVLINKNYKKALATLESIEKQDRGSDIRLFYNTYALAYLEIGEYKKAADVYKEIGEIYHAGFCELLTGNEEEAKKLWDSAPDSAPCRWGKCLLDYIKLRKGSVPTYLQIRNHLETDMSYFIQANKIRYAENLMKSDSIFISVNLESYKLIGKVLLNYGFLNMAKKYFVKSLNLLPEDPENFYYMGKYHYQAGAYKESKDVFEKCLELNKNHVPSKKMLEKVQLKLGANN